MRNVLMGFLLLVSLSAFATSWNDRVDYYCKRHVDDRLYAIIETSGIYTVAQWDVSLGKQPTIAQLKANDAAVDKWIENYTVSNSATIQITPAVQALMDAMNKRLPATNKITEAELTIATTNRLRKMAVQP